MQSERKTFIHELDICHKLIMRLDGDRDGDNASALTVEQACEIAMCCKRVADFLDPERLR